MILSKTKHLQALMNSADSYEEWKEAAIAHDRSSGAAKWKESDASKHFDYVSIRRRLKKLRRFRKSRECERVLYTLNEGVHGNIDGIGRARLHGRARFGTKELISEYIDEVAAALDLLASEGCDISLEDRVQFFRRAQHCYGRSALMMSGSGAMLFFHLGVVKALWQQGLLPDILSGSSGGSIIGSLVSTRSDEDLEGIFEPENLARNLEQTDGLLGGLLSLKPKIASADEIARLVNRYIDDLTFLEAFKRTGRHLNISVAAAERHQTSRLLNAITTPNVYIREAIMASTAVPGVFPPVALKAQNHKGRRQAYLPSRKWVDGSISDDLPAKRLARIYGVNHFIVSQVNPHVLPFVTTTDTEKRTIASTLTSVAKATAREWVNASVALFEKPLSLSPAISRVTSVALGIINQDYIGDINILPDRGMLNPTKLLSIPTRADIIALVEAGEHATWPRIEHVRVQTKISRKLTSILNEMDQDMMQVRGSVARQASAARPTRTKH